MRSSYSLRSSRRNRAIAARIGTIAQAIRAPIATQEGAIDASGDSGPPISRVVAPVMVSAGSHGAGLAGQTGSGRLPPGR